MTDDAKTLHEMYAVRNRDGLWFRAKGYGGYGETWVAELSRAKIYPGIGQARSRVTFFASNYPDYGVPEIVRLQVQRLEVVDDSARIGKALQKKKEAKDRAEVRRYESDIAAATRARDAATARLKALRSKSA